MQSVGGAKKEGKYGKMHYTFISQKLICTYLDYENDDRMCKCMSNIIINEGELADTCWNPAVKVTFLLK